MYDIPCVILAGGKSSRMGEDKSLLPFENCDTLIEYQYKKISKLFKKVYISSKENKFNFQTNLILDNISDTSSPLVALQSIFNNIKDEKVFIITVDTPLVLDTTIDKLINKSADYAVTIAQSEDRIHNLCGVFSRKILPLIDKLLQKDIHKINYLIKQTNNYHKLNFSNSDQFINLNTKEDYNKAVLISKSYIEY